MKSDVLPVSKMATYNNPYTGTAASAGATATATRPASDFSMNSILSSSNSENSGKNPNSHGSPGIMAPSPVNPAAAAAGMNPFFAHMSPFHPAAMHAAQFGHPFLKFPGPQHHNPFSGGPLNHGHPFGGNSLADFGAHMGLPPGMRPMRPPVIEPGQDDVEDDPKVDIDQPELWSEFHQNGTEMGEGKYCTIFFIV